MTKAAKKSARMTEFTSHTLWTAQCANVQGKKFDARITKEVREQFIKTLAASESTLQRKLETFEPIELPEAAALSLIR